MSLSLRNGLIWNFASLIFIGIGGFLVNVLVGRFYGPEALGLFNQVLAIYLIASQVCVGGLYFSTLSFSSRFSIRGSHFTGILFSGLYLALITSFFVAVMIWYLSPFIANLLQSEQLSDSLRYTIPGLIAFSCNKILFAAINGKREMAAYAIGQSARYILFAVSLSILIYKEVDVPLLSLMFSITELILLAGLLFFVCRKFYVSKKNSINGMG